jgi:hypothetical protein
MGISSIVKSVPSVMNFVNNAKIACDSVGQIATNSIEIHNAYKEQKIDADSIAIDKACLIIKDVFVLTTLVYTGPVIKTIQVTLLVVSIYQNYALSNKATSKGLSDLKTKFTYLNGIESKDRNFSELESNRQQQITSLSQAVQLLKKDITYNPSIQKHLNDLNSDGSRLTAEQKDSMRASLTKDNITADDKAEIQRLLSELNKSTFSEDELDLFTSITNHFETKEEESLPESQLDTLEAILHEDRSITNAASVEAISNQALEHIKLATASLEDAPYSELFTPAKQTLQDQREAAAATMNEIEGMFTKNPIDPKTLLENLTTYQDNLNALLTTVTNLEDDDSEKAPSASEFEALLTSLNKYINSQDQEFLSQEELQEQKDFKSLINELDLSSLKTDLISNYKHLLTNKIEKSTAVITALKSTSVEIDFEAVNQQIKEVKLPEENFDLDLTQAIESKKSQLEGPIKRNLEAHISANSRLEDLKALAQNIADISTRYEFSVLPEGYTGNIEDFTEKVSQFATKKELKDFEKTLNKVKQSYDQMTMGSAKQIGSFVIQQVVTKYIQGK